MINGKTLLIVQEWPSRVYEIGLLRDKEQGDVVVGYGAAHKGNTFLNAVGEESKILKYVVDASHEKHGKFLPGSQVPVLAPETKFCKSYRCINFTLEHC